MQGYWGERGIGSGNSMLWYAVKSAHKARFALKNVQTDRVLIPFMLRQLCEGNSKTSNYHDNLWEINKIPEYQKRRKYYLLLGKGIRINRNYRPVCLILVPAKILGYIRQVNHKNLEESKANNS